MKASILHMCKLLHCKFRYFILCCVHAVLNTKNSSFCFAYVQDAIFVHHIRTCKYINMAEVGVFESFMCYSCT